MKRGNKSDLPTPSQRVGGGPCPPISNDRIKVISLRITDTLTLVPISRIDHSNSIPEWLV